MSAFDPVQHLTKCEQYLTRSLGKSARLIEAIPLAKGTREAPWRLDVEIKGRRKSFVLRLDEKKAEREFEALRVMREFPIPTPHVYGRDPLGSAFGFPCFLSDFIDGESLLQPLLRHEKWAESLYLDTVIELQSITRDDLGSNSKLCKNDESAADVLDTAFGFFLEKNIPLAVDVYEKLTSTRPSLPLTLFSNGDLYPDNMLVREKKLVGVIDWETAGFSDPIYEFLLAFFVCPSLGGRGTEERYCRRMGFEPDWLDWYRALELFDTWHWVAKTGRPFGHHTAENLQEGLTHWLRAANSH